MDRSTARTAVVWQVLRRELDRAGGSLRVIDVGGGTGGFAVPLALAGHDVTVIDASPDALAALTRRAAEAGVSDRVRAVQGDADSLGDLVDAGSADLMLCHSVLEVVERPAEVAAALATALRPGGAASVLVANRAAAVLARAVAGQFDVALTGLDGVPAGRDTVLRRYDVESATGLLAKAGLTVDEVHGVRVVADLVPGGIARQPGASQRSEERTGPRLVDTARQPGASQRSEERTGPRLVDTARRPGASQRSEERTGPRPEDDAEREHEGLVAFELAVAARAPYRDIATQLHLLARRA